MGTNEGEENGGNKKSRWITKLPYLVILFTSLLISTVGGCVLGWWLYKYHPLNRKLWMVPSGFVLFLTPIIVFLTVIVPDSCITKSDNEMGDSLSNPNK